MNWKKIDECWKAYAIKNNLGLQVDERNFFYGVHTEYKLTLNQEDFSITLLGDMKKSTQGINYFWTKLSINNLSNNNLAFREIKDFRFLYLFKNNYKDPIKSDLLQLIRNHNAKKLKRKINGFEVKFNYLFDSPHDFKNAIILANKLAYYALNQYK